MFSRTTGNFWQRKRRRKYRNNNVTSQNMSPVIATILNLRQKRLYESRVITQHNGVAILAFSYQIRSFLQHDIKEIKKESIRILHVLSFSILFIYFSIKLYFMKWRPWRHNAGDVMEKKVQKKVGYIIYSYILQKLIRENILKSFFLRSCKNEEVLTMILYKL